MLIITKLGLESFFDCMPGFDFGCFLLSQLVYISACTFLFHLSCKLSFDAVVCCIPTKRLEETTSTSSDYIDEDSPR